MVCPLTSCGAHVLQSLGTFECFSLSQAGVAVLPSQLFCKCIHMCLSMYVCVGGGLCMCTTCANKAYHCKPSWRCSGCIGKAYLLWLSTFELFHYVGLLLWLGREWDWIEHMPFQCQKGAMALWPLTSHIDICNAGFICLFLEIDDNSWLKLETFSDIRLREYHFQSLFSWTWSYS